MMARQESRCPKQSSQLSLIACDLLILLDQILKLTDEIMTRHYIAATSRERNVKCREGTWKSRCGWSLTCDFVMADVSSISSLPHAAVYNPDF